MRLFCSFLLAVWGLGAAEIADHIWTARYVVTMDPARRIIENGAVAVRGERIVGVGPRGEIDRRFQAKRRLDRGEALIAPGFVNTHAHAPMSLLRGLADDLPLQEWLEKHIFPAEAKNVDAEFVRWGTRLACLEMMLSGTTTYTDMYYFEEVVAEATKEAGMRGVLGQTIIGFPVPDAKTTAEGLRRTERFLARFKGDPLIVPAVAPHAVYTNSDETLQACRRLADKHGAPLLIHLSETRRENEELRAKRGVTPTQLLEKLGVLAGRTVAAHAVWLDEADMRTLAARGVGVAHCPSSNTKLASGVAPVTRMLSFDIAVGLGTDGPAGSNNDFDLLEEADLAAKLQKVTLGDPQALPAAAALEMLTIRGARALGLEKEIGSLEPGKRADMIVMRLDRPNAAPLYDVASQMIYALKGADVRDVMVNGRAIVRDSESLTLDRAAILAKAAEYRRQVSESLGKTAAK
jgi:5-methylthioadenosine/S-adenosylhomocysteine deaminase